MKQLENNPFSKTCKGIDISGIQFGNLTAIKIIGRSGKGNVWLCSCSCGGQKETTAGKLRDGAVISCGCLLHPKTHGMADTRIYGIWLAMRNRCYHKKGAQYKDYGGRGITVCDRWRSSFENFYEDMKDGYADNLSIERNDTNGHYEKSNCKWATVDEQSRNKRNNYWFEADGKRMIKMDWAAYLGISHHRINEKLRKGYSFKEIYEHYKAKPIKHARIKKSLCE